MRSDLHEMLRATGAACPVTPTPTDSEKRGSAWTAFATTVLAGTTAGVLLRAHPLGAGVLITAAWAAGTWHGLRHLRAARG